MLPSSALDRGRWPCLSICYIIGDRITRQGGPMAFSVYTIGSEDHVSTTTAFSQNSASAATLSDGRRIVTWASNDAGAIGDIYQQSYAADGTAIGTESLVNTTLAGSQLMPKVAALAGGGWVIVWQSLGQDGD